jgi:hypothetical protein
MRLSVSCLPLTWGPIGEVLPAVHLAHRDLARKPEQLRHQDVRRLVMAEVLDAATAGLQVG